MFSARTRSLLLIAPLALGLVGCSDKTEVQERTKITTPEGQRTITKETKIEDSGSNPPTSTTPAAPSTAH